MIARPHFEDETLDRLLHDRLGQHESDVTSHVETCPECQSRLETLSRDGLSWDEVGELLRDGEAEPEQERIFASFLSESDDPNAIGRFARYEIVQLLGRGGMGIVMRGFDPSLNRYSAIKVLAPELASNAAARRRFSREAKSAAAVVHPHVVPIQTVDEYNGVPYLVMPVVEGISLQDRVTSDGPLDTIEAVRIAAQIAEGLAAAHAQGLVHRDIKPANILLENGVERVQITDFGLARAIDDASMTRSGVIAGTPQYMSPEQAHGDEIDHRSDLFSLGSVIYFMLTGRSPFRAETTMGVLNRIVNDPPRRLQSIDPSLPRWLQGIVFKLLEKRPQDRFQSADELAGLLRRWLAHLQTPDEVRAPERRSGNGPNQSTVRRTLGWITLAAAVLLAAVISLQTPTGTIRVESNSDSPVPIRIRQGDETVKELVVDRTGSTTRLRSGNYIIEIDGDATGYEVTGDRVELTSGETWVARVTVQRTDLPSPSGRTDEMERDIVNDLPGMTPPMTSDLSDPNAAPGVQRLQATGTANWANVSNSASELRDRLVQIQLDLDRMQQKHDRTFRFLEKDSKVARDAEEAFKTRRNQMLRDLEFERRRLDSQLELLRLQNQVQNEAKQVAAVAAERAKRLFAAGVLQASEMDSLQLKKKQAELEAFRAAQQLKLLESIVDEFQSDVSGEEQDVSDNPPQTNSEPARDVLSE